MKQKVSHLAAADVQRARRAKPGFDSRTTELTSLLQTTLLIEDLLTLFSKGLKRWVPHSGYHFHGQQSELTIEGGKPAVHRCQYTLSLDKANLGTLTFMRVKRFSDDELRAIEDALCHLVYPLRNALLYHDALRSAETDPLTGVRNRFGFDATLQRECKLAHRHGTDLSMLLLDIDFFKRINDTFGHHAGDRALRSVAAELRASVRETDIVFRFGGEEFVVLLNNTPDVGAAYLAERVLNAIQKLDFRVGRQRIPITVSIGVATYGRKESPEAFLARTDRAMYGAKQAGRNRVVVADTDAPADATSLSLRAKPVPLRNGSGWHSEPCPAQ